MSNSDMKVLIKSLATSLLDSNSRNCQIIPKERSIQSHLTETQTKYILM